VLPPLHSKHEHLRRDGNAIAARSAGDAIYYFHRNQLHERQRRDQEQTQKYALSTRGKLEDEKQRTPTSALELPDDAIRLALANRFSEIDPQLYRQLSKELQRLQEDAGRVRNYHDMFDYEMALQRLIALESDVKYEEITTNIECDRHDRVGRARRKLALSDQKWKGCLAAKRAENEAGLCAMQEQFRIEVEIFDEQFKKEPPIQYQKLSPGLLHLREQQRHLELTRRFMEAKGVFEEARKLEVEERNRLQERWIADLSLRRAEVIRRWEEKLFVLSSNMDEELFILERTAKADHSHLSFELQKREKYLYRAEVLADLVPDPPRGTPRRSRRSSPRSTSCRVKMVAPPPPKSPQNAFKQRRLINSVVYRA
jgi:hypothetical protein